MGISYATIAFDAGKCDGCGDCVQACGAAKGGTPRIDIQPAAGPAESGSSDWPALSLCRQCGEPKCVLNCPAAALSKDETTGVVAWDSERCVDCLLCTMGCAYGGIRYQASLGHVAKCDMCDGEPACTRACPRGALTLNDAAAATYNRWGDHEDLFVPGLSACQGCNSELAIRHTLRRVGANTVVATPPGCIAGMGAVGYNGKTGTKVPVFHPLLTNTASMLAGIKRYYERIGRPDVQALALAGDGGTVDVGFQSLSGAAERGERILFLCVDNEGYMNTGMQRSGSTSYGSWTSTTPVGSALKGKTQDAKNMPVLMMMHRCAYVATASLAHMDDFYAKLDRAIEASQHGMAYLHLYSPCPTGWRFPSAKTIEICRKAVETGFVSLWEFTPESGLRFTHAVDAPLPVEDYVRLIGKYRHLDAEQIAHIQAKTEEQRELLSSFVRETAATAAE